MARDTYDKDIALVLFVARALFKKEEGESA